MQINYNEHDTIVEVAILVPLCAAAVGMRFLSRARNKTAYGWDDWFALMSLVFFIAFETLTVVSEQQNPTTAKFLKEIYGVSMLVPVCIGCAKFSVLFLYRRIFHIDKAFRISIKVIGIINVLWVIGATVPLVFKCLPIRKAWDPLVPGTCFNFSLFTVLIEVPNSLVDFVMMVMPVYVLGSLQMSRNVKFGVCLIFILGGFVGIIGFVRIGITYHPQHYSPSATGWWLGLQLASAIICCCLPTFRPLFKQIKILSILRTRYASLARRTGITSPGSTRSNLPPSLPVSKNSQGIKNYMRFGNSNSGDNDSWALTGTEAYIGPGDGEVPKSGSYPLNAINVKRDFDIV